jgi:hypothetical protein
MLWRLENGELDGVNPKVIVILAGTNNVGREPDGDATAAEVTRGLKAIVDTCRSKIIYKRHSSSPAWWFECGPLI